ncbi:MAG: hypothetical protein V7629_19130 [Motiliproteus sp.]
MSYDTSPLIFEEHSAVLAEWWQRGLRGKTLVYLDAHLDLQYITPLRLKKLLDADSITTVRSLEKPSHLLPDGDYVHSLENFLYPASRLGIIDHLIWVAPPHIEVGLSPSVIEHVQQMDSITFKELTSFKQSEGGWIEGRLAGLHITICRLEHLSFIDLPSELLLDIDTDFFVTLPQDHAWIDPAKAYYLLQKAILKPDLITVSRSVSSGFMPLRYHYFADYLKALFEQDQPVAAHFETLLQLDRSNESRPLTYQQCIHELQHHPHCAATHYLCARYAANPESHLIDAAKLCQAYADDPFQMASETANRHLETPVSELNRLAHILAQSPPIAGDIRFVALGLAYAERGISDHALHCYQLYGLPHPALALAIAEQLAGDTNHPQLFGLLTTAITEDASAPLAHQLLARFHVNIGNIDEAKAQFEKAHARAPAWLEPLRGLATLHAKTEPNGTTNLFAIKLSEQIHALRMLLTA